MCREFGTKDIERENGNYTSTSPYVSKKITKVKNKTVHLNPIHIFKFDIEMTNFVKTILVTSTHFLVCL